MRIGIDASCWQNPRGFGRFTRELVSHLVDVCAPDDQVVLVADAATAAAGSFPERAELIVAATRMPPAAPPAADDWRSPFDLLRLGWKARQCRADVFWFPSVASYYPVPARMPIVVTFHDAMTEERPDLFFATQRARFLWRAKVSMARRQASAIVAPSENARQRIARALSWPVDDITRIDEGAAAVFRPIPSSDRSTLVRVRYNLPVDTPLVLYVGGFDPHKNLPTLLEAMSQVRTTSASGWHLVLVGAPGKDGAAEALIRMLPGLGLSGRVTLAGFVPDEDLAILYNEARLLVLPSIDEGFGLPVVEAMACGLAVSVSARGSLPDVAGDAGLTFDPGDRADIARAITRLLDDAALRADLGARGLKRAQTFSWTQSAHRLMGVFRSVTRAT